MRLAFKGCLCNNLTGFLYFRIIISKKPYVTHLWFIGAKMEICLMKVKQITASNALCEAYDYDSPVCFSRGLRLDFGTHHAALISGTASVNEEGETIHKHDIHEQCRRTFWNITELLKSEGMTWHDVVQTRVFLRDIDRDYDALNKIRGEFFTEQGLKMYPASVCVEARLCRSDLLVEIEAVAIKEKKQQVED